MTKFVNLTPHAITVRDRAGKMVTIPPSGAIARVATEDKPAGRLGDFPVSRRVFKEIIGLPEQDLSCNVAYITSTPVAERAKRPDVVSPDTGPTAIREGGQVVAVLGFQCFSNFTIADVARDTGDILSEELTGESSRFAAR